MTFMPAGSQIPEVAWCDKCGTERPVAYATFFHPDMGRVCCDGQPMMGLFCKECFHMARVRPGKKKAEA